MIKHVFLSLCLFYGLFTLSATAHACRGPQMETQTFMTAIPEDISVMDIVAKVEITAIGAAGAATVKILESIKGIKVDDVLNVTYDIHSCARDYNVKAGEIYYIAGSLDSRFLFIGSWRGLDYDPYWKPPPLEAAEAKTKSE